MRVLYYCPEYFGSHGGRTHAREFTAALKKIIGHENVVVYGDSIEGSSKLPIRAGGVLSVLPSKWQHVMRGLIPRRSVMEAVAKKAALENFDLVVIRTAYYRNLPIDIFRKHAPHVKLCHEVNSIFFDEAFPEIALSKWWRKFEISRYAQADCVTVVSSSLRDAFSESGSEIKHVVVNQNGVDIVKFCPPDKKEKDILRDAMGVSRDQFLVGYVGGLESFRRVPQVVSEFSAFRREMGANAVLILVGDGKDMGQVKQVVENSGMKLGEDVQLLGWQPHEKIPAIMSSFDVAIMPYTNDYCSPLKLFEYLAMGLATIGPDTSTVRDVFTDGEQLVLVDQANSNFLELLCRLYENPALRNKLGEAGRKSVMDHYTWEKNAQRLLELAGYDEK